MDIRFVVAEEGEPHDKGLRQEFCALREEVYCRENTWESLGSEVNQWQEPYDYLLIVKDETVVGGCVIVSNTPSTFKKLASRKLLPGEIEISRMIRVGARIDFYRRIHKYCRSKGIFKAYGTIRAKYLRWLHIAQFTCLRIVGGEAFSKSDGKERFIPIEITVIAAEENLKNLLT